MGPQKQKKWSKAKEVVIDHAEIAMDAFQARQSKKDEAKNQGECPIDVTVANSALQGAALEILPITRPLS